MRLVGHLSERIHAYKLHKHLACVGIESRIEAVPTEGVWYVWIYDEDVVEKASVEFANFIKNPDSPLYEVKSTLKTHNSAPSSDSKTQSIGRSHDNKIDNRRFYQGTYYGHVFRGLYSYPVSYFTIFTCIFMYIFTSFLPSIGFKSLYLPWGKISLQSLLYSCLFDDPRSWYGFLNNINQPWNGIFSWWLQKMDSDGGLYFFQTGFAENIRQGQIWRLFTPCLLHANLLHLLFNISWAWFVLKDIESRLKSFKLLLIIVLVGVFSNSAQYLASGPWFMGFSGIVCGLVGFVWNRSRIAPWEGYMFPKASAVFLFGFVVFMALVSFLSWVIAILLSRDLGMFGVGNASHLFGGIIGVCLAYFPWFGRGNLR
jgi:GlpG protein